MLVRIRIGVGVYLYYMIMIRNPPNKKKKKEIVWVSIQAPRVNRARLSCAAKRRAAAAVRVEARVSPGLQGPGLR